jgi:hypothetical protein
MNFLRAITLALLTLILASCVPQAETLGPTQSIYRAPMRSVFAAIVQTITTAPAPRTVNGWRLLERNREQGYIVAEAYSRTESGEIRESIVIDVSAYTSERTAVIMQFTEGQGRSLAHRIRTTLRHQFPNKLQILRRR